MMNKEHFLEELQRRVAVLEDAEQQDILAEYAQHIDLRVAGGLTEEEAIRDFGDLDQLAAEILEAYHVKPAFPQAKKAEQPAGANLRRVLGSGWAAVRGWFRRVGKQIAEFFRRAGARAAAMFQKGKRCFVRHPAQGPEAALPEGREEKEERKKMAGKKPGGSFRAVLGRWAVAIGRFGKAALRLMWNAALLLCAAPVVCLGFGLLLCLGLLAVLLLQGYPLAGAAVCCVGGVLFCTGLLGLGSGLIWRRPVRARASAPCGEMAPPLEEEAFACEAEEEGGACDE